MAGHFVFPPEVATEVEKLTGMAITEAVPMLETALGTSFPIVAPLFAILAPLINKADADIAAKVEALEKKVLNPPTVAPTKPVKFVEEEVAQ
jgi:hypothetical protein